MIEGGQSPSCLQTSQDGQVWLFPVARTLVGCSGKQGVTARSGNGGEQTTSFCVTGFRTPGVQSASILALSSGGAGLRAPPTGCQVRNGGRSLEGGGIIKFLTITGFQSPS